MEDRIEETRMRYILSMQKVASSLELIAFDHSRDMGPEHTSELIEIVTRLHRFIEKIAMRTKLGSLQTQRMN